MYNRVILLGRLTKDPELRTTQSGISVVSFTVACDRRFQNKGEEKKADFFNCIAWRNEAEFISRYWVKGRPILVEGELQNRSYVDKEGVTKYITEIIVDRACFTGDAKGSSTGTSYPAPPPAPASSNPHPAQAANSAPAAASSGSAKDFVDSSTDDDYPF